MSTVSQPLEARLRSAGVDPANFVSYGVPAAETVAAGDAVREREVLEKLADFAEALAKAGADTWNPWNFGVAVLARTFRGQSEALVSLLPDLLAFALAVTKNGEDDLSLQRMPPALAAAAGRPWLARASLAVARQMAESGTDSGDALRIALPAIAHAVTGVDPEMPHDGAVQAPPPDHEAEEKAFAPIAAALGEAFRELDAHGVPPTWPIAQGVAAIARAYAGGPTAPIAEKLRELTELCLVLHDAGITPHPSIEYGIAPAFQQCGGEAWLRDEIFPLAFAIASAGNEPLLALQRLGAIYGLGPERGPAVADRLRARAELGLDVGRLLATVQALQLVTVGEGDEDRFDGVFSACESLLEALQAAGMRPPQTFEEGLPELLRLPPGPPSVERIVALARRLVRANIDPGPVLQHGLAPALYNAAPPPEDYGAPMPPPETWQPLVDTIFASANVLLDAGLDPWPWLEGGNFAAARVANGDRAAQNELLVELRELALDLGRNGIDPAALLKYGLRNLAIDLAGRRAVFSETVASLRGFAPALKARGIDPNPAASRGLAAAANLAQKTGAAWLIRGSADLGRRLADGGVDPVGVLETAVPALVEAAGSDRAAIEPLFEELVRAALALRAKPGLAPVVPLHEVVAEATHEAADGPAAIRAALALVRESAEKGFDASALAAAVGPVLAASERRGALLEALAAFIAKAPAGAGRELAAAAATAARLAGNDAATFAKNLDALGAAWTAAGASPEQPDPGALFSGAIRSAGDVCAATPAAWTPLVARLAERVARARKEQVDLAPAWQRGAWVAARSADGREEVYLAMLEAYARMAGKSVAPIPADAPEDARERREAEAQLGVLLLEHVAPLALIGAEGDPQQLVGGLEEVARLRETLAGEAHEARWTLPWIGRFAELVRRVPSAWRSLLAPVLRGQLGAASQVLDAIHRLDRHIEGEEAVALLKHVITQEGVRAPEILWGLLLQGVMQGAIGSLSDERERLIAFLQDVPVVDPSFYLSYRKIVDDASKSDAEKRAAIQALGAGVGALAEAVVAGEVPADRVDDPLLAHVLFHVFPPAVSVTRERYHQLFRERDDHPEHPMILAGAPGTPPPVGRLTLPRGGYRLRDGAAIDPAPFETLKKAVAAVHADPGEEDLEKLGADLFAAWIEGSAGSSKSREAFLARIYRRYHQSGNSLPETPEAAAELLRYREFLADAAREIVQEAFRAARAADPERYEAQARAKLAPRMFVGPGLVRAVWRTVESARNGSIDAATARERLERQLKGFVLDGGNGDRVLASADREALEALLPTLPVKGADVELGNEHVRVLGDLTGADAAAMQRELFGEGETKGKLEYRDDAEKDGLVLELEVTKRRAHVPIGFCEGVCTATDEELWNERRFLQMVIWGDDESPSGSARGARRKRARGGVHLLVVPREGTSAALALPGINPSLDLLADAGAERILEKILEHAIVLAKHAGLGAVWIPDHPGILSNRGPLHAAIAARKLPVKDVPHTVFSYRPYAYSFGRAYVVWES